MDQKYETSISVIIPSHNEPLVDELEDKIESILYSDNRIKNYEIIVIHDKNGDGYGYSLKKGIEKSLFPWILIIDADHSYSPWDIPKLINELPYCDMVVAERRGVIVASGIIRSLGRFIIKCYSKLRSGFDIVDYNSGFRIFSRSLYNRCKSYLPDKFSFTTTISHFAFYNNYKVKYVPTMYQYRNGKSKLRYFEFFNFIRTIEKCKKKFSRKIE